MTPEPVPVWCPACHDVREHGVDGQVIDCLVCGTTREVSEEAIAIARGMTPGAFVPIAHCRWCGWKPIGHACIGAGVAR